MSQIIRRYWKWDEKYNDTSYKLGLDIGYFLHKGLVYTDKDATARRDRFMGCGEGTPRIEASAGKELGSLLDLCVTLFSLRSRKAYGIWRNRSLRKHLIGF